MSHPFTRSAEGAKCRKSKYLADTNLTLSLKLIALVVPIVRRVQAVGHQAARRRVPPALGDRSGALVVEVRDAARVRPGVSGAFL